MMMKSSNKELDEVSNQLLWLVNPSAGQNEYSAEGNLELEVKLYLIERYVIRHQYHRQKSFVGVPQVATGAQT